MAKHGMDHPPDVDAALDRLVPRPDLGASRWRHPVVARAIYAPSVEQALTATTAGQHVLDVGAGSGSVARAMALEGRDVVAIDGDPNACAGARRTLTGTDAEVIEAWFGPGDGLSAGSFDVIRFGLVLHHVQDLDGVLDHAQELLRDGGTVVVEEFGAELIDERLAAWLVEQANALARAGVQLDDAPHDPATFLEDWHAKVAHMQLLPAATVRAAIEQRFDVGTVRFECGRWSDVAKRVVDEAAAAAAATTLALAERAGVADGSLPGVFMRLEGRRRG